MISNFNRFEKQCTKCSCYYENVEPDELVNPDSDCSLEEKTWENKSCNFFDNCFRNYDSKCDQKNELIDRRTEDE